MKNLLITLCLLGSVCLSGWSQTDYKQWETHRFKVKQGQSEMFEKGLAAHNKKFHNADPYKTGIFEIRTGPNSGDYELSIGSMTFTQLEGRPSGMEHDTDWDKNVMAYAESVGETTYWRADKDVDYTPAGTEGFNAIRWRYFTLLPGQRDRYEEQIAKVVAVYKAKSYPASFRVYWKWGASQGPHVCTEIGMKNYAYFDLPNTFEKDFEEVHGAGSLSRFYEELDLCVDRSKTYDELAMFRPDLSSN